MTISRRKMIFGLATMPAAVSCLSACGGGGGGASSSGSISSNSSSSNTSSASSSSVVGYTPDTEFSYRTRPYDVNEGMMTAPAALLSGNLVVTYVNISNSGTASQSNAVAVKTIDPSGVTLAPELVINSSGGNWAAAACVAVLADGVSPGGGFVVAWLDKLSGTFDPCIRARLFDKTGLAYGGEFIVITKTGFSFGDLAIAGLPNGNFVVSWSEAASTPGGTSGIKAQILTFKGVKVGSEITVSSGASGGRLLGNIAALSNSSFVVTWELRSPTSDPNDFADVKAKIIDASGAAVGNEFTANAQTPGWQAFPNAVGLTGGGFVLTWSDSSGSGGDPYGWGVKAQVFTNTGTKVGSEFLVNTKTENYQIVSHVAALSTGGFVATWLDTNNNVVPHDDYIRGQVFSATGAKVGAEFLVSQNPLVLKNFTQVVALPTGGFSITWTEFSGALSDPTTTSAFKGRTYK